MKKICFLTLFILISFLTFSQQNNIKVLDENSNIYFEADYSNTNIPLTHFQEWLSSLSTHGEIQSITTNKGEIIYKGHTLINLSKKPSVFQTQMFFTIKVKNGNSGSQIAIKDIYYKSLPTYGKQGTPSVISYPSDWLAKDKMYKKSGKERWLNQVVKQNTIAKAEELIASSQKYILP